MDDLNASDPTYQDIYRLLPDLADVRQMLTQLPQSHRLAFALCCCERLYPVFYARTAVNTPAAACLRGILDRLWKHALGQEMTKAELDQALTTCRSLPLGNDGHSQAREAIDALDAVITTLTACQQHNLDNVVRTAEIIRNKVDRPLWREFSQQFPLGIGADEHRQIEYAIRSHPTMVIEISTEAAQLRILLECDNLTVEVIAQLLGS